MNAPVQDLMARGHAAAGRLSLVDGALFVEAPAPLPRELVAELKDAKPALLQHLRGDGSDAADWRVLHEERIAIAIHEGGLGETDAKRQALEDCIAFWLHRHPPKPCGAGVCVHCRRGFGQPGNDTIPVLAGENGYGWLHHGCHRPWRRARREKAAAALKHVLNLEGLPHG